MEGVQSDITGAPSASFSSSSSAPFSHTKSRGGKGVEFGAVHVAEFPPAPGQGVPSGGKDACTFFSLLVYGHRPVSFAYVYFVCVLLRICIKSTDVSYFPRSSQVLHLLVLAMRQ